MSEKPKTRTGFKVFAVIIWTLLMLSGLGCGKDTDTDAGSDEASKDGAGTESVSISDTEASGTVYLTGDVKIATDGTFFLDWKEKKSLRATKEDGTSEQLKDVSTAYLVNGSVPGQLWNLLPYDGDLRFGGNLRLEGSRLSLVASEMTAADGSALTQTQTAPQRDNAATSADTEQIDNSIIADASASSYLEENIQGIGYLYHGPDNALDGNSSTAWIESASGAGIGEWIRLGFDKAHTIHGVYISNGYRKSSDLFAKNGRVRRLEVSFSNGSSETFTLADQSSGTERLTFAQPVTTDSVRLTILEVYAGYKYEDTCITELSVF